MQPKKAKRGVTLGRELVHETHVRAHLAHPSATPTLAAPECDHDEVALAAMQIARNPYRPELHHMRGPGPKWYAKHQGRTENASL